MRTIYHQTGRIYNGPQILIINVPEHINWDIDGMAIVKLEFLDQSRNIRGVIDYRCFQELPETDIEIGGYVLCLYDSGRYSLV